MKPLSELTAKDVENIKILSFDADGITVEKGTQISEHDEVLTVRTKKITSRLLEKLQKLKKKYHINISSGRNLLYLNRMFGPVLWNNASIQGEDGLFTLIGGEVLQAGKITTDELDKIESIRSQLRGLLNTNTNIKGFEPKQFIISAHCYKPDAEVEEIVKKIDENNEFFIKWISGEGYDICLKRFNKGTGIEFLAKTLGFNASQVLSVGHEPNDASMLEKSGISVTADKEKLQADFYTENKDVLGGEAVADRLLELL